MSGVSGDHVTGGRRSGGRSRRGHRVSGATIALAAVASSIVVVAATPGVSFAATITVRTTADTIAADGACSLREAITNANTNSDVSGGDCAAGGPGADTINFSITSGLQTITLLSALPAITEAVAIDATTQPGWVVGTTLTVQVLQSSGETLDLSASTGSSVRGLIIGGAGGGVAAIKAGTGSVIAGNWIGINTTGTGVGFGQSMGIQINNVNNVTVGGTTVADRNVIGTSGAAIQQLGAGVTGTQILGNFIGTEKTGTAPTGNGVGVLLNGGTGTVIGGIAAGSGNVISGNTGDGVSLSGFGVTGTQIHGNRIGTNALGTAPLANGGNGVLVQRSTDTVIGGTAPGAGNLISGNSGANGVLVGQASSNTQILGNLIGTNATGTAAIPNGDGIKVEGANGSPVTGTMIGNGTLAGQNVISGNSVEGIALWGNSTGTTIRGNFIGVAADGISNLGNNTNGGAPGYAGGYGGIVVRNYSNFNNIGGDVATEGNVIAYNTTGVTVFSGESNRVVGNRMYLNVGPGLNIGPEFDFSLRANDPGDTDGGPLDANYLQNSPLVAASIDGEDLVVDYSIDSIDGPSAYPITVHFYLADTSLGGEGMQYLGLDTIDAPGADEHSLGSAVSLGVVLGSPIVATATDSNGNTSNFSAVSTVTPGGAFIVNSTGDGADATPGNGVCETGLGNGVCTLRGAIQESNAHIGSDVIGFNIPVAGVQTITPTGALPDIDSPILIDGTTQPGSSCASWPPTLNIELNATNVGFAAFLVDSGSLTLRGMVINRYPINAVSYYPPSSGNRLECNIIGANPAGTATSGAAQTAVDINISNNNRVGGPSPSQRNLITGNNEYAHLFVGGNGNVIQGNYLGTNVNGSAQLGSGADRAILISGSNNVIGGVAAGEGNAIAYASGPGVHVNFGTGNTVRGNRIYSNAAPGIDVGPLPGGVTFNHDGFFAGPNDYQNYPVLTDATSTIGSTRVEGTLDSLPFRTYGIDVFANVQCDSTSFGEGGNYLGSFDVPTDASGLAEFDQTLPVGFGEPYGITATATDLTTGSTSEFSYCRPASTSNLTWLAAQELTGATSQYITAPQQEKWFKFPVNPGDKVSVELTGGPGSAVSLHRDPMPFYNGLTLPENAAVLAAEAADTGFLPSGFLPSGFLPSGFLPSGFLPSGFLPSGFLPSGFLPSGFLPSGFLPSGSLPSGSLPSGSLPSGFLPSGFLPSGFLPSGFLPEGALPSGFLPSGFLPSGFLPSGFLESGGSVDAYSSASRRSLMGVSMDPYAAVQTIERNTFDLQEYLYVRVVGPYSLTDPFEVEVNVIEGVCGNVQPVPASTAIMTGPQPVDADLATVILTDRDRLDGTETEIDQALADLQRLALEDDVPGVVVDLGDGRFPRVEHANQQADANPGCPSAKNAVATEIKAVVDLFRAANVDADGTSLQYIVLAGSADVIPFHQVQDVAGLANEKEYVPPVDPGSPSEAGLRSGLVKGQDFYGSSVELSVGGRIISVPDLAVGRLVDSAVDVSAAVTAYLTTGGVVTPTTSLVTGYDFVGDAAAAIQIELEQDGGTPVEPIIQAPGGAPAAGWTADQLRSRLLTGGHDVVMLSGHFSAGNLLAADYRTKLAASELMAPEVDMTDVIVMALGCHGGFSLPASDLLDGASPDPDWAKAFLRKGAAAYIAATGYAYGDTELTEYGERLFMNVARQMRTGSGPIPMGAALTAAKRDYLNSTAQLTGIDEKTVVEMTLYGLPMMKVNLPGDRLDVPTEELLVTDTDPIGSGPGVGFGLQTATVNIAPNIDPVADVVTKNLQNLDTGNPIVTGYYPGRDGVVANPYEPILPKQVDNVSVDGQVLRGVALRGATFRDVTGVTPLTTAPATEVSVPHQSFNTSVFYPNQMWMPNYYDAVGGGATRLVTVPAQFRSSALGQTDGTMRVYDGLQLQLYYMPSDLSAMSEETRAATISAGPSITGASAAQNGDGSITFSVNAQADGAAGVQSVWVLITVGGSPAGSWAEFVLAPSPDDPTVWTGTLPDPGVSPSSLRFMVQAVGGAGLTTLATNLGAYYAVAGFSTDPPPAPTGTEIFDVQIIDEPQFQAPIDVSARVRTTGLVPVAVVGQAVVFDIGGSRAFGVTDADGLATATIRPIVPPGTTTLQVSLPGSAAFATSTSAQTLIVMRRATSLSVTTPTDPVAPDELPGITASLSLTSADPPPLGSKPVTFVITDNDVIVAVRTSITDFWGEADLGALDLPAGTYDVTAWFGSVVDIGGALPLDGTDDSYLPSGPATTEVTVLDGGTPTITAVPKLGDIDGAPYTPGTWTTSNVFVDFTCTDDALGSGIFSCTDDTTVTAEGITPSIAGTAVDNAGRTATTSVGPIQIDITGPTIAVTNPAPGASYTVGAVVNAAYTCTDPHSGVATCVGTVANGQRIDTATPGPKAFTVNATDALGHASTVTVNYTVTAANTAPVVRADMGVVGLQDVGFQAKLVVLTGSFADVDGAGPYKVSVRWAATSSFSPFVLNNTTGFIAANLYASNGSRVVTVRVCDAAGACGTDDVTVRVGVNQSITPVRQCIVDRGSGRTPRYQARFGYDNPATFPIVVGTVPLVDNTFTTLPVLRGQPQVFLPGNRRNVFNVDFNSGSVSWKLNGKTVTANSSSSRC